VDGCLIGVSRLRMETFYKKISLDARNSSKAKDTISTYKLVYVYLFIENKNTRKSKNALDTGTIRLSMKTEKLLAPICEDCNTNWHHR
jgi:hypothetical protein